MKTWAVLVQECRDLREAPDVIGALMDDEWTALEQDLDGPEIVGPFDLHRVLLYGRRIPHIEACPLPGGMVHLTLDERYGLDLTVEEANRFLPFLADAMAVAGGWACHPRRGEEPARLVPFPQEFGVSP